MWFIREIRVKECENHPGTYFEGSDDVEMAYRVANARITKGDIKLARGETRRDYTDRLKRVYEENSALEECPAEGCRVLAGHFDASVD
jgi:hypothetical protein